LPNISGLNKGRIVGLAKRAVRELLTKKAINAGFFFSFFSTAALQIIQG